jgi:ubiquinone/menaquinone biosynthesis C-methylase UbiE
MKPYYSITEEKIETKKKSLLRSLKCVAELKDARFLDIGCGSGMSVLALSDMVGSVYGIEPSETMLRDARLNKRKFRPKARNIKFYKGDGVNMGGFSTADQFDCVIYEYSFQFIPKDDQIKSMNNTARLLKPNGIVVLKFPVNYTHPVLQPDSSEFNPTKYAIAVKNVESARKVILNYSKDRTKKLSLHQRSKDWNILVLMKE